MDCRAIQRILSVLDPEKTRGLFKRLLAKAVDIQKLGSGLEHAVLRPAGHDGRRQPVIHARHVFQQVHRCSI